MQTMDIFVQLQRPLASKQFGLVDKDLHIHRRLFQTFPMMYDTSIFVDVCGQETYWKYGVMKVTQWVPNFAAPFLEAGGCSNHFFWASQSWGHPMEGFQSKFSNSETHQILDCSTNLKTPTLNFHINICFFLDISFIYYCFSLRHLNFMSVHR